ncbi:hypothetical protein TOK_0359 [Pseudonocardia sp. N23]|nr:hypothetical protein TOK_0359 [Pseudonocardia sp. N23]
MLSAVSVSALLLVSASGQEAVRTAAVSSSSVIEERPGSQTVLTEPGAGRWTGGPPARQTRADRLDGRVVV